MSPVLDMLTTSVNWFQRTEGSDALPGEPREGLSAERAGGTVIQVGPAERPADRV